MKKFFTPFLLLLTAPLVAQPTFNAADVAPEIGTTITAYLVDYVEPGPATAGFVFDVGPLTLGTASMTQVEAPSATPYASSFPGATHASMTISGENYSYSRSAADGLYNMGTKGSLDIVMTDQEKIYSFPLSYQSTWTDTWSANVVTGGQSSVRTGTTTGIYDGYGTLILPYGTLTNVARITLTQTYSESLQGIPIQYESVNTYYMKPGYDMVIFTSTVFSMGVNGAPMSPISSYSIVIDPAEVGINDLISSADLSVYPNPARETVSLIIGERDPISISLLDMLGREVMSVPFVRGNDRIPVDMSGIGAGSYIVRVIDRNGSIDTRQLVIE